MGEAIIEVGLEEVETYITLSQNTFVQYIAMRTIVDLFEEA